MEAFSERYLGLPTATGRITSGTFDHLNERVRSKLQGGYRTLDFMCRKRSLAQIRGSGDTGFLYELLQAHKESLQGFVIMYGALLVEQLA